MPPYQFVEYFMMGFAICYLILEVILNLNNLDNDTSNVLLLQWSQGKAFFIPFVLGAIGGHLFLGTKNTAFQVDPMLPVGILFGIAIAMLIVAYVVPFEKKKWLLTLLLVLGFAYGHFIWSMNFPRL